jgi:EAL domain-containing protein (putative c-di-GMP-specific phosphodiesterase class I)
MQSMRSARPENAQHDPQREMSAALAANELLLYFQPIVVLGTGRIRGVEALVRWHRPDGIVLMPDDFLPAVADTPVMRRLTGWVIDRACAQAAVWDSWTMSVNIAAVDVVQPALVESVDESLWRHNLPPERLTVELTEHAAVQGLAAATDVLQELRQRGVGVALDDFGTGYSSLLYLRDLPVTEVKIDRTFVNGVEGREDDAAIVHSVVMLARAVGLGVVAEGVETPGQARYLQGIGCTCAQGYRYARPAPASAVPVELSSSLFDPHWDAGPPDPKHPRQPVPHIVATTMATLVAEGASLHTIAAALNSEGLLTAQHKRWTAPAVARALHDSPEATSGDENRIRRYNGERGEWAGAGSNRRPSAFQADARTN